MSKKLLIHVQSVVLLVFLYTNSYSQEVVLEQLSVVNGLSQNTVRCIMQDRKGFMWFGTINGLNRYDGFKFQCYKSAPGKLDDNRIKELVEDKHGFIWIRGFNNKYYCLDPNTNQFMDYLSDNSTSSYVYNGITQLKNGDICLSTISSGCLYLEFNTNKWIPTPVKNRTNNSSSLSDDRINFTYEDSNNNLWIGTQSSLGLITRADIVNKSFKVRNYFNQTQAHNFTMVDEDSGHNYFFTRKGVVVYSKATQEFEYIESPKSTNALYAVKYSPSEYLLVTTNRGVLIYDTQKKSIYPFPQVIDPSTNIIAHINRDNIGGFWITNNTGNIWRLDSITRKLERYRLISPVTQKLIDNERIIVLTDKNRNVWLSTYGEGLYRYRNETKSLDHFLYSPSSNGILSSNYLLSLFCDKSGILWVGTEHTGINKISYIKNYFSTHYLNSDLDNPSSNFVRSIFQDKDKNIWVSTKDGRVTVFDDKFNKSKIYTDKVLKSLNIQGNVYCFALDTINNWIWLGTKGNGVYAIDPRGIRSTVKQFRRVAGNTKTLSIDQVYSITRDYRGRLWFATFGGGVSVLDVNKPVSDGFTSFFTSSEGIKQVRCIISDKNNNIWMGTSNGVIRFHPDSILTNPNLYTYFIKEGNNQGSLSSNEVKVILEDKTGNIWIGTSNGLNKFIPATANTIEHFQQFYSQDGLSNDIVQALAEDKNADIWVGTENGLSVFHTGNITFRSYRPSGNALGNLISELAATTLASGELLFGSANGFYVINTDNFKPDTTFFPITLTNFILSGVLVDPGIPNSVLPKAIFNTKEVVLNYTQNSFSIEFATLVFDSEHNYFSFMLENYDKEWNNITNSNLAVYKNLSPGKYVFKVKYLNPTGQGGDKITKLNIVIKPPIWRTKVAFILYFAFTLIILLSIRSIVERIHKLQHSIEIEKQLTEYKIKFFTNVSHEFRTPLSLILSSMERIGETIKLAPALHKHILVMQRNTNRLLQLMDQLLDFAKVQNKSMKLNIRQTEVIGLIKSIYNNFYDLAEKKDITYHFSANSERCLMHTDQNIIDKVLYNLLSNAFKFTGDGGQIDVFVTTDEVKHLLTIIVKDNGSGIPEDKQDLIFKRFAQIQTTTTGIGLSLTRELIDLHKGEIRFTSKPEEGTVFKVVLNTDVRAFDKESIEYSSNDFVSEHLPHFLEDEANNAPVEVEMEALNNNKILIVEDNSEIRDYLADYLSKYFIIDQASNGLEGLQKAIEWEPDLIVCDIVMPEMNGIEVTKKLKGDFQTSHIPILLLTAITSDEKKLEATQAGADEYMTKPFSIKYLLTKIFKLIEQRELLRKRFSTDTSPISFSICKTDKDKLFLEKANLIAEQQIMNTEFSVDDFAKQAGLGRTVFYKKLKGITGYTPNEFIRIIRMKRSLELLSTGDFTVSEVAHKVGMNDPFYFSRCFKSQFGQSPSIYIKGK